MIPISLVSVFNQSKLLTDIQVQAMVAACGKQLADHVAPAHGRVPALEFVPAGSKMTQGGTPCYVTDDPDVADALGYHDEDESGNPYIKVFAGPTLKNGGTALLGKDAVSVTLSHELIELVGDAPANIWVDGPNGVDYAYELCDAVESDVYEIDGVSVSNFLYEVFFDPRAQNGARFDYMGTIGKPFTMTAGGYQITRAETAAIQQVFGRHDGQPAHDTTFLAREGVVLVFGPDYPMWKRASKISKAMHRRGHRRAA